MSKSNESVPEKPTQAAPAAQAKPSRPRVYAVQPGHSVFCRLGNVYAGGFVSGKQFPGGEPEAEKLVKAGVLAERK